LRIFRFLFPLAIALAFIGAPVISSAQVYVSITAPPVLPQYQQPQLSNPNYIWTPGYWAVGGSGYYWVAGSWQQPPQIGLLWTPGYWGYNQGQNRYNYNQGYWGRQVGYYGGVNYGYGYYGNGYNGGSWQGNSFRYNTAVSTVNTTVIRNVYVDRTVVVTTANRTSYNGGRGGLTTAPNAREVTIANQQHYAATTAQRQRATEAVAKPAPKPPAAKPAQQKPPAKQDKPAGGDKPAQTPPVR
jgi:WXXGXW repeat (2 copies)